MSKRAKKLKRIGRIRAIIEGKLVVEGDAMPKLGDPVYNSKMEIVGIVSGIFGPINHFFIEINPSKRVELKKEEPLYVLEDKSGEKKHTLSNP